MTAAFSGTGTMLDEPGPRRHGCPAPEHAGDGGASGATSLLPAGSCHCAAIQVDLVLSTSPARVRLRACQCGFCGRRGARTISDRDGTATIRASGPDALIRYRFGLRTADYLLCASCGTYVAAIQPDEQPIGVINVGGLGVPEFEDRAADPVDYRGETMAERLARRRGYWMPVSFAFSSDPREGAR